MIRGTSRILTLPFLICLCLPILVRQRWSAAQQSEISPGTPETSLPAENGNATKSASLSDTGAVVSSRRILPDESATPDALSFSDPDIIALAPLTVYSGAENPVKLDNPSRFVEIIPLKNIDERQRSATDILGEAVGVQVKRYGGLGAFATISIRGSSASQVEVFLDGVPIGAGNSQSVNLEDLPLNDLQSIEIYRGQTPINLGAGAIGGAVNLITRRGKKNETALNVTYGDYTTTGINARHVRNTGRNQLLVYLGLNTSRGDFPFESDNGTPLNPDDDYTTTRANNHHTAFTGTVRYQMETAKTDIRLSEVFFDKTNGLPGVDYNQALHPSMKTVRSITRVSVIPKMDSGIISGTRIDADGMVQMERYRDRYDELGIGVQDINYLTLSGGVRLSGEMDLGHDRHHLRGAVELRSEAFQATYHLTPPPNTGPWQSRITATTGLEDEFMPFGDALSLLPGLRVSRIGNHFSGDPFYPYPSSTGANGKAYTLINPSFGIAWRAADYIEIKANAGRFARIPAFYELFGDRGGIVGNGLLEPEQSLNTDAGLSIDFNRLNHPFPLTLELSYFENHADNLILLIQNSQDTARAENISASIVRGIEIQAHGRIGKWLAATANYTFQDAVDASDIAFSSGKQLPGLPAHEFHARADVNPAPSITVFAEYHFQSKTFWDRMNQVEINAREIVNAGVTWRKKSRGMETALTIEVKNMFDNRITDVARYPLPGRTFSATVGVKF